MISSCPDSDHHPGQGGGGNCRKLQLLSPPRAGEVRPGPWTRAHHPPHRGQGPGAAGLAALIPGIIDIWREGPSLLSPFRPQRRSKIVLRAAGQMFLFNSFGNWGQ